jgi:signal transduction histidine kinase/ligand-binding sensor domain-containing protein
MRLFLHRTLVVLFAALPGLLTAQVRDVTFERVPSKNPLEGNEVHCILQDHRGYLWVGTETALNRYDGYGFTVFKHDLGKPGGIVSTRVQSLWEDKRGVLWVGTWNGLERFDRISETFVHFLPSPAAPGGDWSNVIYGLREDSNGTLWIGGDGLKILDRSTGLFTSMRHDSTNPATVLSNNCDAIFEDSKGILWIGTSAGLDRFDQATRTFSHLWADPGYLDGHKPNFYGNHWIQEIYEDRTGRLWLCTNGGPVAFNRTTGEFKPYFINRAAPDSDAAHSVSSMCEDDAGTLWIGVWGGGIMSYDAKADSFVSQPLFKSLVSSNSVATLFKDKAGTVWIGTLGNGLWKIVPAMKQFAFYTHDPNDPNGLSNNEIRFFYEPHPGIIAVATALGADNFDRRSGAFRDPVASERPYALTGWLRSRTGVVYTGVIFDGFNIIHENPYRRRFLSTRGAGLGGFACSLFEDRKGIVWMLTSDAGVSQFDPRTEKFKALGIGKEQPFVSGQLIIEDSLDNTRDGWALWLGTQDGLWRYNAKSETFTRFGHDPRDPASVSSNSITTVFRDTHGTLWIGTDQGLNKLDPAGGGFTCYGESSGLPDQHVSGILEDSRGYLWVSARSILSKFDPRTGRFRSYSMKEGIKDIQFYAGCCLRSSTGEMYFGGQGGFVLFHPYSIRDNLYVPPIVLTGLRTFEKTVALDSALSEKRSVELSYKDNLFSLEFAALDFTNPEANQYAFILEGHDTSWNYVGSRQFARYVNVEPGRYTFRVKGSNNDGLWNEAGTSVAIVITPPWWRGTWFTLCLWATALLSVGGSIRYVERRKLKKRIAELEREHAVERERARISQDMHDEVGSSLSEIAILSELAKRKPEEATGHVEEISERAAELINNVSEIVWAMNPKNDTLDNLIGHLRRYAVKYLNLAGISCDFTAPDSVPASPLHAEVRQNLFLVVKESLHNIVKHSGASVASILLALDDNELEIRIDDNGRGFSQDQASYGGNGLSNMKKRIADLGGTLSIESQEGCGTKVVARVRV